MQRCLNYCVFLRIWIALTVVVTQWEFKDATQKVSPERRNVELFQRWRRQQNIYSQADYLDSTTVVTVAKR